MHSFTSLCMGKVTHSGQAEMKSSAPQFLRLTEPAYIQTYIPSAQLLDRAPLSNSASDTVSTDTLHSTWRGKSVR